MQAEKCTFALQIQSVNCLYMTVKFLKHLCLIILTFLFVLSCSRNTADQLEHYVVDGVSAVVEVSLFRLAKHVDKNEFLSMPIVRDRMEYTRFGDLYTRLMEAPEESGIKLLDPLWVVSGEAEGQPITYVLIKKQKNLKFENFLKQAEYQEFRALEGFKVLVKAPFAIAFDRDMIILGKADQIPWIIENLKRNQSNGKRPELLEYLRQIPGKQIIRFAFNAGYPDFLEEQKDRLYHCGLDWKEKDSQFISGYFKTQGLQISINLHLHFEDSWETFYRGFFAGEEENGPIPNVPQGAGSVFRSSFSPQTILNIANSACPIDLMEKYISIPSRSLILKELDCMDGHYGIMIPDYEVFLENHIFFFTLTDPTPIKQLLADKAFALNENLYTFQNPRATDPKDLIYYALKDNILLISRNALNLIKLAENGEWQDWLLPDKNMSYIHMDQLHVQSLLGSDDAKESFFKEINIRINPASINLQLSMDPEGPGAWNSVMHFINHLYTNNKDFYEWWDNEDGVDHIEL